MRGWGIVQCCTFCGELNETRDHLFFACPYSFTVWMNISGRLLGSAITPDWDDTITTLLQPTHSRMDNVLRRLCFQTVLYALWKERNARRHARGWQSTDVITRSIDKLLQNRISSLRYAGNHPLEGLRRRWFELSSP